MDKNPMISGDTGHLEIHLDNIFKISVIPVVSMQGVILQYLIFQGLNAITSRDGKVLLKFQSYEEALSFYTHKIASK